MLTQVDPEYGLMMDLVGPNDLRVDDYLEDECCSSASVCDRAAEEQSLLQPRRASNGGIPSSRDPLALRQCSKVEVLEDFLKDFRWQWRLLGSPEGPALGHRRSGCVWLVVVRCHRRRVIVRVCPPGVLVAGFGRYKSLRAHTLSLDTARRRVSTTEQGCVHLSPRIISRSDLFSVVVRGDSHGRPSHAIRYWWIHARFGSSLEVVWWSI